MHRILRAEMVKCNRTILQLASEMGISEKTLRNKINGDTDFTLPEAQTIRRLLGTKLTLDELFEVEEKEHRHDH
jgi:plasmid maintenance system antidote protein VapI